jgi:hypothetical protein
VARISGTHKDRIFELIDRFFASADPKVTSGDYSFLTFYRLAPHLLLANQRQDRNDSTLANLQAAARAVGALPSTWPPFSADLDLDMPRFDDCSVFGQEAA